MGFDRYRLASMYRHHCIFVMVPGFWVLVSDPWIVVHLISSTAGPSFTPWSLGKMVMVGQISIALGEHKP